MYILYIVGMAYVTIYYKTMCLSICLYMKLGQNDNKLFVRCTYNGKPWLPI